MNPFGYDVCIKFTDSQDRINGNICFCSDSTCKKASNNQLGMYMYEIASTCIVFYFSKYFQGGNNGSEKMCCKFVMILIALIYAIHAAGFVGAK